MNTCAVMMVATPASMAAAKGRNSRSRSDLGRVFDQRQLVMRVGAGVAVPGKVLAARRHTLRLQHPDDGRAESRHGQRLIRERAVADDRVLRVRVDVEDRRVIERDADRAKLRGQGPSETLGQAVSPLRPSVAIGGHSVNGAFSRATRPPSWSTLTQAGSLGRRAGRCRTRVPRPAQALRRCERTGSRHPDRTRARATGARPAQSLPLKPAISN